jgi:hypothetical protein
MPLSVDLLDRAAASYALQQRTSTLESPIARE